MSTLQEALNRRLESRFSVGAVIIATFMLALRRIHIFLPLAVLCYAPMVFLGYGIAWRHSPLSYRAAAHISG